MKNVTKPAMHPAVALFVKITAVVAVALIVLWIADKLLRVVFIAAVVAAIAVGVILLYNFFRRRSNSPVIR
jgi:predicted lysophospholipase L1 biosynthesis ABC-type transport system permease subunit